MKTIKKNNDFQKVYEEGKKIYGHYCLIFYKKEIKHFHNQYGFVASKKIGNAVCRNRIKRIFREFVKNHFNLFPKNYSFIIVAKKIAGKNIKVLTYKIIEKDLLNILAKKEVQDKNNENIFTIFN